MNEDLINVISESQKASEAQEVEKKTTVWLIFSIAGKKYAMRSADVLEIIRDVPIYKLPFMPAYIEGVINRRGDPFTVINPLTASIMGITIAGETFSPAKIIGYILILGALFLYNLQEKPAAERPEIKASRKGKI